MTASKNESHYILRRSPQSLFAKLQQLAVAGDILLGKEKVFLLARLTDAVLMWLSNEEEFQDVLEHESAPICPIGLQQLIDVTDGNTNGDTFVLHIQLHFS